MSSFLYRIAQTYYTNFRSDIRQFTFVFPNRRAGLFFRKYLSEIAEKPVFSPEIITINECFASASIFKTADRIENLFRLYKIYIDLMKVEESFDNFVFWGEMLLTDFDEIDKHLVDAKQLYTNLSEIKDIDLLFNEFSEQQIEAIRQFWKNFDPASNSKSNQDFISTWRILYPVYEKFKVELINDGIATEGMICRDVVERLKKKEEISSFVTKQFVFVGFNALNPCEKTLMLELKKAGNVDFYWDYESSFLSDPENPASTFMAENKLLFPSQFDLKSDIEVANQHFELISVSSGTGQTKQVYSILQQLNQNNTDSWINTAVVLPDENLLLPMLNSIPEGIRKINVTMGYPLKSTPVSGFIEHVFELQKTARVSNGKTLFYFQAVLNIINHQYISSLYKSEVQVLSDKMIKNNWIFIDSDELHLNGIFSSIFILQNEISGFTTYLLEILKKIRLYNSKIEETEELDENFPTNINNDFIFQYYIAINRLQDITQNEKYPVMNFDTLMKLIRELTNGISIPFVGEPLNGLQLIGVLETRGIDFENLIITSFNEGILPKKRVSNSFIPYHLKKGFGLPTYEHHDAISSYNFYRLIHRAKNVYFLYDARSEGNQTGEISRFFYQLSYLYKINIERREIAYNINFPGSQEISIKKTPEVIKKLDKFFSTEDDHKALSASSIKEYIDCPLQFYLSRVEEIQQSDEVKEIIEESTFGSIFHATMENIYESYVNQTITQKDLDELIKNKLNIDKQIIRAFQKVYFKNENKHRELEGNNLLIANVIKKYVVRLLESDKQYAPFQYIDSEKKCEVQYPIKGKLVNLKGYIDRIDEKDGLVRILDYKTGSGKLEFKNMQELFEHNNDKRPKYVFQTFFYGILYKNEANHKIVQPGIFYIKELFRDNYMSELKYKPDNKTNITVTDFKDYEEEFTSQLTQCLEEIFNPNVNFFQSTSTEPCKFCPYKQICNR